MKFNDLTSYLKSCFILVIPVFIWNIIFAGMMPEGYSTRVFWKDIPVLIAVGEDFLKIAVFFLPLLIPLSFHSSSQRLGLIIYVVGLLVYGVSWLVQIYFPESAWCNSVFGFLAPAYTMFLWLVGIGIIGDRLFIKIPYHYTVYIIVSAGFVALRTWHTYIVFKRL
jgi:hypothetical protein